MPATVTVAVYTPGAYVCDVVVLVALLVTGVVLPSPKSKVYVLIVALLALAWPVKVKAWLPVVLSTLPATSLRPTQVNEATGGAHVVVTPALLC